MNLILEAKQIFGEKGWRVHDSEALHSAGLEFDLAAESDQSLVFLKMTRGSQLGEVANRLAGEIASITLREGSGAKAWEAYLILLVSEDYEERLADVQSLQYDFTFCRRVVLDLSEILSAEDPEEKLRADLGFLFPLGIPTGPFVADIRQLLASHLAEQGIDAELAQDLTTHFDDTKCRCSSRVDRSTKDQPT